MYKKLKTNTNRPPTKTAMDLNAFLLRFSESVCLTGSPETSCHSATTMDLFPTKENNVTPQNLTTMDLLYPRAAPYARHSAEEVPTLVKYTRCVVVLLLLLTAFHVPLFVCNKINGFFLLFNDVQCI